MSFFYELFGMTRSLEERSVGFAKKRDVREGGHLTQRRRDAETQRKI
jgi:hypothetical protein